MRRVVTTLSSQFSHGEQVPDFVEKLIGDFRFLLLNSSNPGTSGTAADLVSFASASADAVVGPAVVAAVVVA